MITKEQLEQVDAMQTRVNNIIKDGNEMLKDLSILLLSKCPDNRIEFDDDNIVWGVYTDGFHEAIIESLHLNKEDKSVEYKGKVFIDDDRENIDGTISISDTCNFEWCNVLHSIINQLKDSVKE